LLEAAAKVFVRDGYEKAALADIAETAGKTRGAVYTHFKDKEEMFLSLVVDRKSKRGEAFAGLLSGLNESGGISASLQDHVEQLSANPNELILFIEFQLYAVRNPHVRNRLDSASGSAGFALSTMGASEMFIDETATVFTAVAVLEALQIAISSASLRWDQAPVETIAAGLLQPLFHALFERQALK